MSIDYDLFIGGQWVASDGSSRFDAINPFDGQPTATITNATATDVHRAVERAQAAFPAWRRMSGVQRAKILHRIADLVERDTEILCVLETTDNGKVIRETRSQMGFVARQFRFYAGYADKIWGQQIPLDMPGVLDYTKRDPLGVVAILLPWNSPMSSMSNKVAPALAAGNCVILKPSEHASVTSLEFARRAQEAGLPDGVLSVVTGLGDTGAALAAHPGVAKIALTGSTATGQCVAAAAATHVIPSLLELGGKSANIVFEDADLDRAVVGALAGIFAAAGQTCIAGSRLLVQRGIYDEVVERLTQRTNQIRLGNPLDDETEMGPVANKPQWDRVNGMIADAVSDGARLVTGGKTPESPELGNGYFVAPTILADVSNDMPIARDEVFGPVLSILPFETEADAVAIANDSPFGLAAGLWTENVRRALRLVDQLDAGTVWVNTYRTMGVQAPFGGIKGSGYGRERGELVLHEFTAVKNVMIDYSDEVRDPFRLKI